MDQNLSSGVAALIGATIGGLASLGSSWMTQWFQLRDKNLERDRVHRETLYSEFISETSRLYGDALSHQKDEFVDLVGAYALISRMRLIATPTVVAAAEGAMRKIVDTYLAPNKSLSELKVLAVEGRLDILLEFAEACRADIGVGGARAAHQTPPL